MKAPPVVLVPLLDLLCFILVAASCCCCYARPLDGKIETILSCAKAREKQQQLKEQQHQEPEEPSSLARLRLSKFHGRIKGLGGSQDGIIVPIVDGITTGGSRDNMMMRMRMKETRGGMMMMMKTSTPTSEPTDAPTGAPTDAPTPGPTGFPTAMPTIPECTSLEILYRVAELQTGMNETSVGNTLTFDVYHPETLEVVGKYTDAATTVAGDDCIYVGSYAFYDVDDNTSTFDSQITLLATCSSAVNAITGGTGRYACVKGVEEFPGGDVSYPEGYFGSMLHLCGGRCNNLPAGR